MRELEGNEGKVSEAEERRPVYRDSHGRIVGGDQPPCVHADRERADGEVLAGGGVQNAVLDIAAEGELRQHHDHPGGSVLFYGCFTEAARFDSLLGARTALFAMKEGARREVANEKQWNKKIGRKFVTIRDLAITLLLDAVYAPVGEHSVVATE